MAVVCAISGVPPEEPVVSVKSGFVFEKRLVIKHLKQAGTCPMTKEELRPEDLLPLKVNTAVKPRPASASSIPGMLQVFQNEWDAVMLETHTLKQHLEHLRQELAHTLYKHDAACRVIARLVKERDDAKRALGATESNIASAIRAANAPAEAEPMEGVEGQGAHPQLPVQDAGKINEFAAELSKSRKGVRKAREAKVNPREKVQGFKQAHSYSLHSTSTPGVTALDLHAANHDLAVTGGADGGVIVFNLKTGKNVDTLSKGPHKKRITEVAFHPTEDAVVSTAADGTAAVWRRGDKGKFPLLHQFHDHKSEITGLSMHPCGDYFATAGADRTWALYDIKEGKSLLQVSDKKVDAGFSSSAFHPDGILFGLGSSDSIVRIYDLNDTSKGIQPLTGHSGVVTSVTFSENGYHVASADDQGVVKIWDLRKLAVLQNITVGDGAVKRLAYDLSGNYLAVGGQGVNIYGTKDWDVVAKFSDHKDVVNSVKFGPDASFLASVSSDRTLKIFS